VRIRMTLDPPEMRFCPAIRASFEVEPAEGDSSIRRLTSVHTVLSLAAMGGDVLLRLTRASLLARSSRSY
jgi:hypothetical protein